MSFTPKPGDFGLTHIHGNVGSAIAFGQFLNGSSFAASGYEHAFMVTHVDDAGQAWIVEAEPGGARYVQYRYPDNEVVWYSAPAVYSASIAAHAENFIGVPYSFLDYASLAALRLHLSFAPGLRSYVKSTGHMICSQLVDAAYQQAGVQLFDDGRFPGDVTPADLYGLIVKQQRSAA